MIVRAHIPGKPVSWKRARVNGRRHFTSPKDQAYRDRLRNAVVLYTLGAYPPIQAQWNLTIWVSMPMTKRKKPMVRTSDLDNFAKIVGDALEGVLWENDKQIVDLYVHHCAATQGGGLWIEAVSGDPDQDPPAPPKWT